MAATENQMQLFRAMDAASFDAGQDPKPAVTVQINGHEFTVKYSAVNRKCYDFLPTPTSQIKVNGKVVSYKKAVELAK